MRFRMVANGMGTGTRLVTSLLPSSAEDRVIDDKTAYGVGLADETGGQSRLPVAQW